MGQTITKTVTFIVQYTYSIASESSRAFSTTPHITGGSGVNVSDVVIEDSKRDFAPREDCSIFCDIGVSEDQNVAHRKTQENTFSLIDYFGDKPQAFFGIYDGHGGSMMATVT